jgi:hypothetical protein
LAGKSDRPGGAYSANGSNPDGSEATLFERAKAPFINLQFPHYSIVFWSRPLSRAAAEEVEFQKTSRKVSGQWNQ